MCTWRGRSRLRSEPHTSARSYCTHTHSVLCPGGAFLIVVVEKKIMWPSQGHVVRLVTRAAAGWVVNPRSVLPLVRRQVAPCHGAAAQAVVDRVLVPANKFRNIAVVRTISILCEALCINGLKWRCLLHTACEVCAQIRQHFL